MPAGSPSPAHRRALRTRWRIDGPPQSAGAVANGQTYIRLRHAELLIQEVMRADVPWRDEVVSGGCRSSRPRDAPQAHGIGVEIILRSGRNDPFDDVRPIQWYSRMERRRLVTVWWPAREARRRRIAARTPAAAGPRHLVVEAAGRAEIWFAAPGARRRSSAA